MKFLLKQIILIILLICSLFGNETKLHLSKVDFKRSLNCMHQDSDGYLWMGTNDGLYKYNGADFKAFKINPYVLNSISDDNITGITETSNSQLIIGTKYGSLNVYDLMSEKFNSFENPHFSSEEIKSLITKNNLTWYGTKKDLFLVTSLSDSLEAKSVGINHEITDISYINENNLIISTQSNGFYIINHQFDNEWKFEKEHYLHDCTVNFIYPINDKIYLISTAKGFYLYNFDKNNLEKVDNNIFPEKIYSVKKSAVVIDDIGNLWIGKGYNLYKISSFNDLENIQISIMNLDIENKYSSGINSLFFDNSGVLWISLRGKGLYKYYPARNFSHLNIRHGLMSNIVFSVIEHNSHSILVGTHHGLFLYDFNQKIAQRLPNTEELNFKVITSLYKDKNMNLWCGTNNGLYKLTSNQKLIHYKHFTQELSSISSNLITSITGCQSIDGDIWVATQDGLNRYRVKYDNFLHYFANDNQDSSLTGNDIEHLFLSSDNDLWIGTNGTGLCKLPSSEVDKFEPKFEIFTNNHLDIKSISDNKISFITEDKNKKIWIGTKNGGLNTINFQGFFEHFLEVNGIIDNHILSIVPTANNFLWISTPTGITKFDLSNYVTKNYYFKDGLKDGDYISKSACITNNSRIIFGSQSGYTFFNPEKIHNNEKKAIPQISGFYIYNHLCSPNNIENKFLTKSINQTTYIELPYNKNVISMDLCGLHFVNPDENNLAYYMEGIDTDWSYCKNNKYITYSNLNPGKYTFHLKASNNDNIWNPTERILVIKIIAPFWSRSWFKLIIISFLFTVIYFFIKFRISHVTKRKITLEKQIWEKNKKNEELNIVLQEVQKLKNQLQNENTFLKSEIQSTTKYKSIVTDSKNMKNILHQVEIASGADPTILILGESGTGKDLLAKAIHQSSSRNDKCFIKVDCAALPPNLIESELFGHEKGAFTGANKLKIGRFELANGGTIFLDEIGELPIKVQQKLLRVLQSGEFERLGNSVTIKTNTRIVAATNRNLEKEVKEGQFREDLFYRLNVFPINIPPLRERIEDIPLLVQHFVSKYSEKFNKTITKISKQTIAKLMSYSWPGNIRELENIIQRSIIISPEHVLELGDWFEIEDNNIDYNENIFISLEEIQKRHIERILEYTNGKVSGENGAAEILKINAKTLFSRMKKMNINN